MGRLRLVGDGEPSSPPTTVENFFHRLPLWRWREKSANAQPYLVPPSSRRGVRVEEALLKSNPDRVSSGAPCCGSGGSLPGCGSSFPRRCPGDPCLECEPSFWRQAGGESPGHSERLHLVLVQVRGYPSSACRVARRKSSV